MPEGPEVRIIAEQLEKRLIGASQPETGHWIQKIEPIGGRYLKNPIPGFANFKHPTRFRAIHSKGKLIVFRFENGWNMFSSLGMTGSWGETKEKHSAVRFEVVGPFFKEKFNIYYTDPRRFGRLEFQYGIDAMCAKLKKLGPDLTATAVGCQKFCDHIEFREKVKKYKKTIAEALMDQKLFAGVGNYIKSEALYRAHISPWRSASSLDTPECNSLFLALMKVMKESYESGGATLATYKHFDGKTGDYSKYLKVYGKTFDPRGNLITKETTKDGRTTWWVPGAQI